MTSFCCPICGTPVAEDDDWCRTCNTPITEMKFFFNKVIRERAYPRAITDPDAEGAVSLGQAWCPNCGTQVSGFCRECHACGFPIENEVEEDCGPVLRTDAGFVDRRRVATDPRTSEAILRMLSNDALPFVRRGVAANPSAPIDILIDQSASEDASMRAAVASNPSTPISALDKLSKDEADSVKRQVVLNDASPENARHEALSAMHWTTLLELAKNDSPEWLLETLTSNGNEQVRNKATESLTFAQDALDRLSLDQVEAIRNSIGREGAPLDSYLRIPALPPELIYEIAKSIEESYTSNDPDQRLRNIAWVAERENLNDKTIHLLATSRCKWELLAVADDPRISDKDLEELSRHPNPHIRAATARNPKATAAMLERLACDEEDEVKLSLLWNPRIPKGLIGVIECRGSEPVADVLKARSPDILPEELEELLLTYPVNYRSYDKTVARTEAAQNAAAPAPLLDILARDSYREVRQAVLRNANASERVIHVAKANDAPTPIRGRSSIPKTWNSHSELDDLQWLWGNIVTHDKNLSDTDYDFLYNVGKNQQPSYLVSMATHEAAPIFIFERIASSVDMRAREGLASNRCIPTHLQRKLAFDKSALVRRKLAENDFVTLDTLDILSYDVDNLARTKAQLRLRKLLL